MLEDNFSGYIDMFLVPMTLEGDCCTITYVCTSITETDQEESSISCDDLLIDLDFDDTDIGDLIDG